MSDGFDQPHEISNVQHVFPAHVVGVLIPDRDQIPRDYEDRELWEKFVRRWFFHGDPFEKFNIGIRDGVDGDLAIRHIGTVMRSFEPKHEHKVEASAWLLSRWFDGIEEKPTTDTTVSSS